MPLAPDGLALFRTMPLIRSMNPESQEKLAARSFLQQFPERLRLVEEGQAVDNVYIVVEGLVALRAGWLSNLTTLRLAGPGDMFPLGPAVLAGPSDVAAETLKR